MSSVRHPAMTPATAAGRVAAIALIWAVAILAPAVVPAAIGGLLAVLLSMMSPLLAVLRGLSASGAGVLPGE